MTIADVFADDFNYRCDKLPEYAREDTPLAFSKGAIHASKLHECLTAFRERLASNSDLFLQSETDSVIYALTRLKRFFEAPDRFGFTSEDAFIFAVFVDKQAKIIRDHAKEYDNQTKN